ncbi:hypothetical protein BJX65DRAFT_245131 [Aspergillus insuetus]
MLAWHSMAYVDPDFRVLLGLYWVTLTDLTESQTEVCCAYRVPSSRCDHDVDATEFCRSPKKATATATADFLVILAHRPPPSSESTQVLYSRDIRHIPTLFCDVHIPRNEMTSPPDRQSATYCVFPTSLKKKETEFIRSHAKRTDQTGHRILLTPHRGIGSPQWFPGLELQGRRVGGVGSSPAGNSV